MLGLFRGDRKKRADALVRQVLGGQAVLMRMFSEAYGCTPNRVRRIELTYFALAVMAFTYFGLSKGQDREKVLDDASIDVLQRSIPTCGEDIDVRDAARQYQRRYQEYCALIAPLVGLSGSTDPNPTATLGLHLYECVTGGSARDAMLRIATSGDVLNQYVIDHIEYVKLLDRK